MTGAVGRFDRGRALRARIWKTLRKDPGVATGGLLLILMFVVALAPGLFTAVEPTKVNGRARLQPPSAEHVLGTDELGRDLWSRVIHGARVSLLVSFFGVMAAMLSGTTFGVISGYRGGTFDSVAMRILDVIMAFPTILLALLLVVVMGSGIVSVVASIAFVYLPRFARVARGLVLQIKEEAYVEAARALGNRSPRIMAMHIAPNITTSTIVLVTVSLGSAILLEATLSFLGLGLQPPYPAWGYMLSTGKTFMELSVWPVLAPGVAIMLTVMGFNLVGDGLRDIFDPKEAR